MVRRSYPTSTSSATAASRISSSRSPSTRGRAASASARGTMPPPGSDGTKRFRTIENDRTVSFHPQARAPGTSYRDVARATARSDVPRGSAEEGDDGVLREVVPAAQAADHVVIEVVHVGERRVGAVRDGPADEVGGGLERRDPVGVAVGGAQRLAAQRAD